MMFVQKYTMHRICQHDPKALMHISNKGKYSYLCIMDLRPIKERFSIIGDNTALNRAIEVAVKVAGTDLSVLVTGESGVGKESIPQIIHQYSSRKHSIYIAVNCGAIPEGTIDSELFGHEKGAFTGASEARKGYFEVADGGTIFLDEIAELPMPTQARLLRVLQNGEFIRVGSSKVQKCNVRVVAATNVNLTGAIQSGKFREDLYYRLNTVPIMMPALRDRKEDIPLLFRKFVLDFSDKYKMPAIRLDKDAANLLQSYRWPGNIRQLKNVAEQMSVLEQNRDISEHTLRSYLPAEGPTNLPVPTSPENPAGRDYISEREIFNRILFQLQKEVESLRHEVESLRDSRLMEKDDKVIGTTDGTDGGNGFMHEVIKLDSSHISAPAKSQQHSIPAHITEEITPVSIITEEDIKSIHESNTELIKRALKRHGNNRKEAAKELGISERTLYRKLRDIKDQD